jgi:hypothetical protein
MSRFGISANGQFVRAAAPVSFSAWTLLVSYCIPRGDDRSIPYLISSDGYLGVKNATPSRGRRSKSSRRNRPLRIHRKVGRLQSWTLGNRFLLIIRDRSIPVNGSEVLKARDSDVLVVLPSYAPAFLACLNASVPSLTASSK